MILTVSYCIEPWRNTGGSFPVIFHWGTRLGGERDIKQHMRHSLHTRYTSRQPACFHRCGCAPGSWLVSPLHPPPPPLHDAPVQFNLIASAASERALSLLCVAATSPHSSAAAASACLRFVSTGARLSFLVSACLYVPVQFPRRWRRVRRMTSAHASPVTPAPRMPPLRSPPCKHTRTHANLCTHFCLARLARGLMCLYYC